MHAVRELLERLKACGINRSHVAQAQNDDGRQVIKTMDIVRNAGAKNIGIVLETVPIQ